MRYILITLICFAIIGCESHETQNPITQQSEVNRESPQPSSQSQSETDRISINEKFSLLYESLKDIQSDYYTDIMKTLAFLIIGIGWFITSNKSRDFFRKNRVARISSLIAVVVLAMIHIRDSIGRYLLSKRTISLLENLSYIGADYYGHSEITTSQLIMNLLQNAALFAVLIVILYSLKTAAQSHGDKQ